MEESATTPGSGASNIAAQGSTRDLVTPIALVLLLAGVVVFLSFAPGAYNILKAFHVLAAVIWVGGGVTFTIAALFAQRTKDPVALGGVAKQAETLGKFVFTPASMIVLAFGIALVFKGHWGWSRFWIDFALAGYAASLAIGLGYMTPTSKKLGEIIAAKGVEAREAQERIRQILMVARIDIVILVLVVIDMVAKPTF